MAAGTVTTTADIIGPKTPTALRVAFTQSAGDQTGMDIAAKGDNDYVTKLILENFHILDEIDVAITPNSSGFFDYAYDGSLGTNPTAYLQIRVAAPSAGWQTVSDAIILDSGDIYVQADFSVATGDTYRLVIKP